MVKKTEEQEKCTDIHCPIHAGLRLRGRDFVGIVKSSKAAKTVTVEWERRIYIHKFERYEKRYSRIKAHNPGCINAKEGDKVKIKECRPLSKTKKFAVIEIIKQ